MTGLAIDCRSGLRSLQVIAPRPYKGTYRGLFSYPFYEEDFFVLLYHVFCSILFIKDVESAYSWGFSEQESSWNTRFFRNFNVTLREKDSMANYIDMRGVFHFKLPRAFKYERMRMKFVCYGFPKLRIYGVQLVSACCTTIICGEFYRLA